ncbi:hypothetical protein Q765_16190 [Flavobacterium rivuli WB 3.3-2 = DSM 21788]|uniref:Uncharacterized protein n=1 Tax=Flavobacterium rivuli WB 3.3-2 = DSM 21788 TaxID=1121895 RepID=A0A0A2LZD9_9FLAO|nr:hypothetical protein Q765_16190 [Flavobacterium rivuli WB 3.3-2 = DSM 21788]
MVKLAQKKAILDISVIGSFLINTERSFLILVRINIGRSGTLDFLKVCGLSGIAIEHLILILTFLENLK